MGYKDASGTTNSIVWQAPAQGGTAASVTLSFAGASGYGTISRHAITLPLSNAPGSTATSTATQTTPPPTSTSLVTTLSTTVTQPVTSEPTVTSTTTQNPAPGQNSGNLS